MWALKEECSCKRNRQCKSPMGEEGPKDPQGGLEQSVKGENNSKD